MGFDFTVIVPLLPSHCGFSFVLGCGVSFLVSSSVLLLMIVQQLVVILVFSQEKHEEIYAKSEEFSGRVGIKQWIQFCAYICTSNFIRINSA